MNRRMVKQGDVLWRPAADAIDRTSIARFMSYVNDRHGLSLDGHVALQRWSTTELERFWEAVWDYFAVRSHAPFEAVLHERVMPGARWFPGARLNYAEHLFHGEDDPDRVVVVARSQTRDPVTLTVAELHDQVARARAGLERLGVGPGDRVAAYLPNIPETLVAFAATVSLGAVWASCAPEFGYRSVIDRFGQIEPKVLLAIPGYRHGAKWIDRRDEVASVREAISSVEHVVEVAYGDGDLPDTVGWSQLLSEPGPLAFLPVAFDHPMIVLFSSGTTGLPKAIVHGHGVLTEQMKTLSFSWDVQAGDRLQWFTTTAWMMWNSLISALLLRASIVMLDGSPVHPDLGMQWALIEEVGSTHVGLPPPFVMSCRKAGLRPGSAYDLSSLKMAGVSGSPLAFEAYPWLLEQLPAHTLLNNGSGGTDVCSGIVSGSPLLPVYAGEIAGRALGVASDAFDASGRPIVGELGELVITEPMPSMPVGFWNDPDGTRLRETYFDVYPGVWRHGDWILFTERGTCMIAGRSDATLNRGGVRLGTTELYAVVEEVDEVLDSLVVHLEDRDGGKGDLILFVVLRVEAALDDELRGRIRRLLRDALSPRHVPDRIVAMPHIPRTLNGKKLEVPVKRILQGRRADEVTSADALARPDTLEPYVAFAGSRERDEGG
jgi:acetoacetyl-CoA synthetase